MAYLNIRGIFEIKTVGKLEFINEILFMFICHLFVLFANLLDDFQTREFAGTIVIITSLTLVGINVIFVLYVSLKKICEKLRVKYLQRKQKKMIKKHKEK